MRKLIILYNKDQTKEVLVEDKYIINKIDLLIYGVEMDYVKSMYKDELRCYIAGLIEEPVKSISRIELDEPHDFESRTLVANYYN